MSPHSLGWSRAFEHDFTRWTAHGLEPARVEAAAPGMAVHAVRSVTGDGVGALAALLRANRAALLGASGAGKSSRLQSYRRLQREPHREQRRDPRLRAAGRAHRRRIHRELRRSAR